MVAFISPAVAEEINRPSIWVKQSDRQAILEKINTETWAKSLFDEMKSRVEKYATLSSDKRKTRTKALPLVWLDDKTLPPTLPKFRIKNGGTKTQRTSVVKALQDAVDCGVLYYLTQEDKYAVCGADTLYTVINALKSMKVQKQGPMNSSWMFPTDHLYEARVIGAQLPIIYDFVAPYLKSGGKVYDIATEQLVGFNFADAQNTFKTYIWLALNKGLLDSNWPVLESSSLVHNILALEDPAEIEKYLPYYTHKDTKHQASLRKVAQSFKNEGDIWPESMGYSRHVASFSIYLMTLLDRYNPDLKLGAKYPNIPAAFMSYYNLKYPNEAYPFIGDGHRNYHIEYSALEMAYLLAKLNNNTKQINEFGNYLASSIKKEVYNRGHLHKRSYGAAPYYTPTQLLWYSNSIKANTNVEIAPARPRTKRLEFAGIDIQRNTQFKNPVKNSLMGFVSGGSYIHGHASGMDMELYGQGYVLGIDGGKGKYRTDMHENYYRLFAAHNTVISNGASASKGGWINLGINKVKTLVTEPNYDEQGVSAKYSFTRSTFYDEFNLVAPAHHQRTLALIKISETQGYYVDIFQAKSNNPQEFHDYVYHNIGDKLTITANENPINMKADPTRYQASAKLPWTLHREYKHPGWHFFDEVKTSPVLTNATEATFSASKLAEKEITMRAIIPAGTAQTITQAKAPQAYGAAQPYQKKPLPTFILRKQGEAWSQPFSLVFESKTQGEHYAVQSVERLNQANQFKGLKVTVKIKGKDKILTQYIISQQHMNDTYHNPELDLYFKGRFAVISLNDKNQLIDAYIGNGHALKYKAINLDTKQKTSLYRQF